MDDRKKGRGPNDQAGTDAASEMRANLGQKEAKLQTKSEAKLGRMSRRKQEVPKDSKDE